MCVFSHFQFVRNGLDTFTSRVHDEGKKSKMPQKAEKDVRCLLLTTLGNSRTSFPVLNKQRTSVICTTRYIRAKYSFSGVYGVLYTVRFGQVLLSMNLTKVCKTPSPRLARDILRISQVSCSLREPL